jgi:hypothetical protein
MRRFLFGIGLVALGFLGGLLAQQPPSPPRGFDFSQFMRRSPVAFGTVASVQGNTLIVEASFGDNRVSRTVTVPANAQVQRSQPGTKADIKQGSVALVQAQPDPQTGWLKANTVVVMPNLPREGAMVIGKVYDVKGGGSQFGISAPVLVNPDARIYKLVPIKLSDIKQGERVFVRGNPDEQGNLTAETIVVGEMPPMGVGGVGFGRGGPGGFGPRGFQGERRQRTPQQ